MADEDNKINEDNKSEDLSAINDKNKNNTIKKISDKINSEKTQNDIKDFINSLLLVIIMIVPFIVINYGKRYYVDGKVLILYVSAVLIFVLLMLCKKITISLETKIALVFLATICISAIFSKYSSTALWGSIERHEGCVMFFVYIVLFIAASSYFTTSKKTMIAILTAGSFMSIYTVLQMFGIDPIQIKLYGSIVTPNTSIATIGNSNFVSTYLSMFLIIAVALYIYKKRIIYLVYSGILFLGFLAARTRGGWLSFAVLCVIGLVFVIKQKDKVIRSLIVIVTFIVLTFSLNIISDNKIFDRAKLSNIFEKTTEASANEESSNEESQNSEDKGTSVAQTSENETSAKEDSAKNDSSSDIKLLGSVSSRTNILRVTFKAFLKRPFLGEGPDTLGLRLKKDFSEEYYNHVTLYNEGIDKAHNEYLEYATSEGIFTLIAYLALTFTILFKLFKNRKNENNVIIFLGILMYMIQAFFNISVIMVAPLFWIMLGYGVKSIYNNSKEA